MEVILADLLIAYVGKKSSWAYRSLYRQSFVGEVIGADTFTNIIGQLQQLKYVQQHKGGNLKNPFHEGTSPARFFPGLASRFRATERLIERANEHGLSTDSMSTNFASELPKKVLKLKALSRANGRNKVRGRNIQIKWTPELKEMSQRIKRINKYLSEQSLQNTDLEWTIIRPSSLFGDPRGEGRPEFCMMLDKLMLNILPFPSFLPFPAPAFFTGLNPLEAGKYSLSMVHAKDVAKIFIKSLADKTTISQTLEIGGLKEISWNEIVTSIVAVTGQKIIMTPAPFGLVALVAGMLDRFEWFPAGKEQLQDLVKGSVCDSSTIFKKYEIEPIPFNVENLAYLKK